MLCLVSFAIAHQAITSVVLGLAVSPASQESCNFLDIPPSRSLVRVHSAYWVSAATMRNSFDYCIIVSPSFCHACTLVLSCFFDNPYPQSAVSGLR